MLKISNSKSNVQTEPTQNSDFWRTLYLKSPEAFRKHSTPQSFRHTKDHSPQNPSFPSRNLPPKPDLKSPLTLLNQSCSTLSPAVHSRLHKSFCQDQENLTPSEHYLLIMEQNLNKKISQFEQERNKWSIHISLKLKDLKSREAEFEANKKNFFYTVEKAQKSEEHFCSLNEELYRRKLRLEECERNYMKREGILNEKEEKLEMKVEDIAGYERRLMEFESSLWEKEAELEKVAELIEVKKGDIERTANMFELINKRLKKEEKSIRMQKEANGYKERILRGVESRGTRIRVGLIGDDDFNVDSGLELGDNIENDLLEGVELGEDNKYCRINIRTPE